MTTQERTAVGMSPEEYARANHLQPAHVRALLRCGKIPGRQFGKLWRVLPEGPAHDDHDPLAEALKDNERLRDELAAIKARIEAALR